MADQQLSRLELLQRRLALVGDVSALNAQALKLVQALGAIEMDLLRIELETARTGGSEQLVRDLHEAEMEAEAIRLRQVECEERIVAAEAEIAEADRLLAAAEN